MVGRICKIRVFHEVFFSLGNCCYDNWKKCTFSVSIATIVREKNSLITIKQLINLNYPWKNKVKQKDNLRKIVTKFYLLPHLFWSTGFLRQRGQTSAKNYFFGFLLYLPYTGAELICLACHTFFKSLLWRCITGKCPWWIIFLKKKL